MASVEVAPRPDPEAAGRVIVVGAGLAGLTAALHLRDGGWDVVVLEARTRVGGRVYTLHGGEEGIALDRGLHAEAGGESIDENHTAIRQLLARFAISTERRPGSTDDRRRAGRYLYRGRVSSVAEFMAQHDGEVLADHRRVDDEMLRLVETHRIDAEHPETADDATALDALSFSDWLDSLRLRAEARFVVQQTNTALYNAELTDLSMLFIAQQVAAMAGVPASASETMRVAGGNSRLPQAIAAELGTERVVVDAPVTAVRRTAEVVRVTARDRHYFGAHVVLCTPPPTLRAVEFDPPLPAAVSAAIAGLDLGPATKVVTQFRSPFWRDRGESGYSLNELTYRTSWDPADSYDTDAGLLTTFTTADHGRALAGLSEAARAARVGEELAMVFPEVPAQLAGPVATVAWSNEPFTTGGYAAYKPGQVCGFWPALRDGIDRIHFAGEHLEAPAGYLESAVRSGLRAATRLGKR
jgi:monoamine oxidase